jgi:hypothetical protein
MASPETPITPSAILQKKSRVLETKRSPFSDDKILEFEQLQDQPSARIRESERPYTQLMLDLDGGKLGGGFIHARIDERTDARGQRIAEIGGPLIPKIGRCRAKRARGGGD